MSDYMDFKARESQDKNSRRDISPDVRIPVVSKDVNLESQETKEGKCKELGDSSGRRRKLSAELIFSAIQKKASTITTNWRSQKSKSSPEPITQSADSASTIIPIIDRKKLTLPVQKLTTIPSVDYQSDSDPESPSQNNDIENSTSPTAAAANRGILKKVSNVELPNLELLSSPANTEEISPAPQSQLNTNNSPSRMVKFDMPSFDSHTSEEHQQDSVVADLSETDLREVRVVTELSRLLEKLQSLEINACGDHEVLETFSVERIMVERNKWLEILRKSLSNVLRIQQALEHNQDAGGEVACHLIHKDYRDAETQSELVNENDEKDAKIKPETLESETQTDEISTTEESTSCYNNSSCPNIRLNTMNEDEITIDFFEDEDLRVDLEQLKYCLETAIVDDYVIL